MSQYDPVAGVRHPHANRARYQLDCIGRSLQDLAPSHRSAPRSGGVIGPLCSVALGIVGLIAFMGWLLVGPPLPR